MEHNANAHSRIEQKQKQEIIKSKLIDTRIENSIFHSQF